MHISSNRLDCTQYSIENKTKQQKNSKKNRSRMWGKKIQKTKRSTTEADDDNTFYSFTTCMGIISIWNRLIVWLFKMSDKFVFFLFKNVDRHCHSFIHSLLLLSLSLPLLIPCMYYIVILDPEWQREKKLKPKRKTLQPDR